MTDGPIDRPGYDLGTRDKSGLMTVWFGQKFQTHTHIMNVDILKYIRVREFLAAAIQQYR